jgi:hypothetical protein
MAMSPSLTSHIRAWSQVATAVALVAEGRYPRVVVTAVANAARVAQAIRPDAERCGVEVLVEDPADGPQVVVVRRR